MDEDQKNISDNFNNSEEHKEKNKFTETSEEKNSSFNGYAYSDYNIYSYGMSQQKTTKTHNEEILSPSVNVNYYDSQAENRNMYSDFSEIDSKRQYEIPEKNENTVLKSILRISLGIFAIIFLVTLSANIFVNSTFKDDSSKTSEYAESIETFEYSNDTDEISKDKDDVITKIPTGHPDSLKSLSQNTVNIIKNVKPSVVCISSIVETTDFFNFSYESTGSGSGVIFDKDDENIYIITNCHVIDGAKDVGVSIEESDLIEASLIGKSTNDDLAVIAVKIKDAKKNGVKNVKVSKLGDSDKLTVSSPVIAIGNALGEGNTATFGIISTTAKELTINNTKLNLIQTDAEINPGNSGGALVNGAGEVIGINTAKIASTSVEGVGYSIPINTAKPIIESIFNKKDAPMLGVYVATITESMSNNYSLPQTGVIITRIIDNSSASEGRLYEGDVITSFNGNPIFTADQLTDAVSNCKVGDVVTLTVIRNKHKTEVKIKLKENVLNESF